MVYNYSFQKVTKYNYVFLKLSISLFLGKENRFRIAISYAPQCKTQKGENMKFKLLKEYEPLNFLDIRPLFISQKWVYVIIGFVRRRQIDDGESLRLRRLFVSVDDGELQIVSRWRMSLSKPGGAGSHGRHLYHTRSILYFLKQWLMFGPFVSTISFEGEYFNLFKLVLQHLVVHRTDRHWTQSPLQPS